MTTEERDTFIKEILRLLPEEGLIELNELIDNNTITEESLNNLLKKYNINSADALKNTMENK